MLPSSSTGGSLGKSHQRQASSDTDTSNRNPRYSFSKKPPPTPNRIHIHTTPRRSSVATLNSQGGELQGKPARVVYNNAATGGKINFPLLSKVTTIGRKEDNSIVLFCVKISKYHATIEREANGWAVRDCNSSNGVKVNDRRIPANVPKLLTPGDKISIGTIHLSYYEDPVQGSPGSPRSPKLARRPSDLDAITSLVTILPSGRKYEETVSIRAELQVTPTEDDFLPEASIDDAENLRRDYEKLRLAYQLSKLSLTSDLKQLLTQTLDLMFSVLPVDRCVVLLVDNNTGTLTTNMVKIREGKGQEGREILLSSTILQRVYESRTCLITSDACEDPKLGKSASISKGQIRSVICVPLIAHDKVLGILHLDSKDKIGSFVEKDLALVKAISNQTAIFIENAMLFKGLQAEIKVREQLSRFLPPHVVHKMVQAQETVRKGGQEMVGTVIFADIRGFTLLSERCSPSEVFDLLNDFFERLVKIVFKFNGVVDKYIGDAIMGVFGTLEDETEPEFKSVSAALEFKTAIHDMNEERKRHGKEEISVGIGLNTGMLVSGFVGCSQRLEYTVIGDTVNTSSRICGLAKANQVLISESTFALVKDKIETKFVGQRQFKGKSRPVGVYEALAIKNSR